MTLKYQRDFLKLVYAPHPDTKYRHLEILTLAVFGFIIICAKLPEWILRLKRLT